MERHWPCSFNLRKQITYDFCSYDIGLPYWTTKGTRLNPPSIMIPDSFQTIAEISLGLAGFSGLIVALRKKSGPFTDVQKFRLYVLFGLTFGAMFLSLLPHLLVNLQIPDARLWFDCSIAMISFSLVFSIWMIRAGRRTATVAPEIFNWAIFFALTFGHGITILLQFAVIAGIIEDRAPGAFMLGLVWYLLHATFQFVRMLFVLPKNLDHT